MTLNRDTWTYEPRGDTPPQVRRARKHRVRQQAKEEVQQTLADMEDDWWENLDRMSYQEVQRLPQKFRDEWTRRMNEADAEFRAMEEEQRQLSRREDMARRYDDDYYDDSVPRRFTVDDFGDGPDIGAIEEPPSWDRHHERMADPHAY